MVSWFSSVWVSKIFNGSVLNGLSLTSSNRIEPLPILSCLRSTTPYMYYLFQPLLLYLVMDLLYLSIAMYIAMELIRITFTWRIFHSMTIFNDIIKCHLFHCHNVRIRHSYLYGSLKGRTSMTRRTWDKMKWKTI